MPEPNPEHLKAAIVAINGAPFFRHLSMRVADMGAEYAVVELDVAEAHMNPFGGVHGGVYASALDTAAYWSAYWSAYCDLPEGEGLISIDLVVDFLAPVTTGTVRINGQRIKAGRTLYLTEAKMFDRNGKMMAHGTSKLMVTPGQQSLDDLVRYLGAGGLPPKFLET